MEMNFITLKSSNWRLKLPKSQVWPNRWGLRQLRVKGTLMRPLTNLFMVLRFQWTSPSSHELIMYYGMGCYGPFPWWNCVKLSIMKYRTTCFFDKIGQRRQLCQWRDLQPTVMYAMTPTAPKFWGLPKGVHKIQLFVCLENVFQICNLI